MTASDHLSHQQFMSVSDLLHMQSNDAKVYKEYHPEYGIKETTVQATYSRRAQHIAEDPGLFHQLDEPIRRGTIDPVQLYHDSETNEPGVFEGHHRIVRAHQLGVDKLPVSYSEDSQVHHDKWLDQQTESSFNQYWAHRGA